MSPLGAIFTAANNNLRCFTIYPQYIHILSTIYPPLLGTNGNSAIDVKNQNIVENMLHVGQALFVLLCQFQKVNQTMVITK